MSENTEEAYELKDGDEVTLVTDKDNRVTGKITEKNTQHPRGDTPAVWEQNTWILEAFGTRIEYVFGKMEGVGSDEFPEHIPLHKKDAEVKPDGSLETLGHIEIVVDERNNDILTRHSGSHY